MSKVILFNMVSLDGFFETLNGDIDWHTVDEEFNDFAANQLDSAEGLIFGRVTYQLMESYWPTPGAVADDPLIAEKMNALPKLVVSRSLEKAAWNNSRLVKDIAGEIRQLKQQPGRDWLIFGSASLAAGLIAGNLIDEFRIMVAPVVLGKGRTLFEDLHPPLSLKLLSTRTFGNGNVLLVYKPG
jgi:dihydrofolate reductase